MDRVPSRPVVDTSRAHRLASFDRQNQITLLLSREAEGTALRSPATIRPDGRNGANSGELPDTCGGSRDESSVTQTLRTPLALGWGLFLGRFRGKNGDGNYQASCGRRAEVHRVDRPRHKDSQRPAGRAGRRRVGGPPRGDGGHTVEGAGRMGGARCGRLRMRPRRPLHTRWSPARLLHPASLRRTCRKGCGSRRP